VSIAEEEAPNMGHSVAVSTPRGTTSSRIKTSTNPPFIKKWQDYDVE